jgi:hypothetical protein
MQIRLRRRRPVYRASNRSEGMGGRKKDFGAPFIERRRRPQIGGRQRAGRCGDILCVVAEEVAEASCHRAARRARDHP